MKLEEQVTSLELSRKLKELGVKQKSLWYWLESCDKRTDLISGLTSLLKPRDDIQEDKKCGCIYYSAFTCAELSELLPMNIEYFDLIQHK